MTASTAIVTETGLREPSGKGTQASYLTDLAHASLREVRLRLARADRARWPQGRWTGERRGARSRPGHPARFPPGHPGRPPPGRRGDEPARAVRWLADGPPARVG